MTQSGPHPYGSTVRRSDSQAGRRTSLRERGAAVVEMALVAPVIVALLLGTFEAGWYLHSLLSVEQMARESSRTLSIHGSSADGDQLVLETVLRRIGANKQSAIERVVLYPATDSSAKPPAECMSAPAPGPVDENCTVYLSSDLGRSAGQLTCVWCLDDRVAGEYVGVAIRLRYTSPTGLVANRFIDHSVVLRLELPSGGT